MMSFRNLTLSLIGTFYLLGSPVLSMEGEWDELKEGTTRQALTQSCLAGFRETAAQETEDQIARRQLWIARFKKLKEKGENDPLSPDEYTALKNLKAEKTQDSLSLEDLNAQDLQRQIDEQTKRLEELKIQKKKLGAQAPTEEVKESPQAAEVKRMREAQASTPKRKKEKGLKRYGQKLANHYTRDEQRKKNLKVFGIEEKDSKILKMVDKGKLIIN